MSGAALGPDASVAVAAGGLAFGLPDHVVVDPLGDQATSLIDRCFGMVDAIEGRAGMERLHVDRSAVAELTVRGHDRALAASRDDGRLTVQSPVLVSRRMLQTVLNYHQSVMHRLASLIQAFRYPMSCLDAIVTRVGIKS